MTDESQEITESEASNQEDCTKVALRIFEDACVLYDGERYQGALYLSGYVIENGIKSELYRLGNKSVQPTKLISYINTLLDDYHKYVDVVRTSPVIGDDSLSSTRGLLSLLNNILDPLASEKTNTSNKRLLKNYFSEKDDIKTMLEKKAPSTNSNKFHNIEEFLKQLENWRKLIADDEHEIRPDDYKITGWKSSLRYSIPNSNYNIPEQERAKEALKRAYSFLRQVVYKHDSFLANETAIRVVHENFPQADEVNTITTSSNTNMEQ